MRTAIYVDGFNLYYGALKGTPYKWLDLNLLCRNILHPLHQINSIVYCTAMVRSAPANPNKAGRQKIYLKALQAHIPCFKTVYGHFGRTIQRLPPVDQTLGPLVKVYRVEEKRSDVNLAVHLVNDARLERFDCAVVVSNDGDLAEALRIVKEECGKKVGLFTPGHRRVSTHLRRHSHFQRMIRTSNLAKSRLPNPIPGTRICKPKGW